MLESEQNQADQVSDLIDVKKSAAWNASQAIIDQVGELLAMASHASIQGDHVKAFYALKECKHKIFSFFTEKEIEEFTKKEVLLTKLLSSNVMREENIINHPRLAQKVRVLISFSIDQYHKLFMQKLTKYGYGIGLKEDKTIMKG